MPSTMKYISDVRSPYVMMLSPGENISRLNAFISYFKNTVL